MTLGEKVYAVTGEGSPLGSRETLRAAMLLALGFRFHINAAGQKKCFQDITVERTGKRHFVLVFDATHGVVINGIPVSVRDAGEAISTGEPAKLLAEKHWIYKTIDLGSQPVRRLAALTDDTKLIDLYQTLLKELSAIPRHVEVETNGRRYFLTYDATPEQRAAEMAALDKRG